MARAMWSTSPRLQGIPGSQEEAPDDLLWACEGLMDLVVIPPLYGTGDVVNDSEVRGDSRVSEGGA